MHYLVEWLWWIPIPLTFHSKCLDAPIHWEDIINAAYNGQISEGNAQIKLLEMQILFNGLFKVDSNNPCCLVLVLWFGGSCDTFTNCRSHWHLCMKKNSNCHGHAARTVPPSFLFLDFKMGFLVNEDWTAYKSSMMTHLWLLQPDDKDKRWHYPHDALSP